METEHVLVVPAVLLRQVGYFQGFCSEVEPFMEVLFQPQAMSYRPRQLMERDPSYKQLIPYVIFRYRRADGRDEVFTYTRGCGQGEQRLHAKRSIGVGGHISSEDARQVGDADVFRHGMQRELDEEVIVRTPYTLRCVGLINDDTTDVGRVHLGLVYMADVERPAIEAREAEMHQPGFQPVRELLADCAQFETWSQICLEALFA